MEKVVWSCNDYSIFRVGTYRLHDVASFVVTENYNHHSSGSLPDTVTQEVEDIYNEELSYSKDSLCFIVRDKNEKMIGSIRVFKWDKQTPTPCRIISIYLPWRK